VTPHRSVKFELDDKQWASITERLKLPDDARFNVAFAIHAYREQRLLWKRSPAQVAARLKRISDAAEKLAKLLDGLEEQERIELIEAMPTGQRYVEGSRIEAAISEVRGIETMCAAASKQVSKIGKIYLLDGLIASLDGILREFSDMEVSQEKPVLSFLTAVCGIADAKFGSGSVKEAIRRFKPHVEFPEKDFSKPDVNSGR
jgi:hypothetical protein